MYTKQTIDQKLERYLAYLIEYFNFDGKKIAQNLVANLDSTLDKSFALSLDEKHKFRRDLGAGIMDEIEDKF